MIHLIAAKEFKGLFLSPLAWVTLAVVQFILAWVFLAQLEAYIALQPRLAGMDDAPGVTELVATPVLGTAGIVLLMVAPLFTMRGYAEERRARTLTLLRSSPVSVTAIVLGKLLGLLGFFALVVALAALMPLSLLAGGALDPGQLVAGLLALLLLLAAFAAIGLFMSSLTAQPQVAAVATYGLLLFLWIIEWASRAGAEGVSGLFAYLSLMEHFQAMLRGLFSSADVAFFLILTATFSALTVWRLDLERVHGGA